LADFADHIIRSSMLKSSIQRGLAYGAMVLGAIALVFLIVRYGERLTAPALSGGAPNPAAAAAQSDTFLHLLIALAAVILVGRLLGRLCAAVGQPPVIGDVIAGVLLGPSLLGALAPRVYAFTLPPEIVPPLGIVAQFGVVLYMFMVGVELNPDRLRGQFHAAVAISHASIVVPFVMGAALAVYLYPRFGSGDVSFTTFALFLGIAMSITAFPVLARILSDLGISRTPQGVLALTCAAIDDVTAWCLLAVTIGIIQAATGRAVVVVGLTLAFILTMFAVVRPVVRRLVRAHDDGEPGRGAVAAAIVAMLVSALVTEAIGVHAIFGAFLLGAVIPHDSRLAGALVAGLDQLVTILLLPAFFAFAGIRTEIGLISGWGGWLACGLIILVASAGKILGTLAAGRATGLTWRDALSLGVLMNTRGLMQLIVLNLGLDLGVITPTLFTMMVLMALATTMATAPVVTRLGLAEPHLAYVSSAFSRTPRR
jgi:K+:H+ antiporter